MGSRSRKVVEKRQSSTIMRSLMFIAFIMSQKRTKTFKFTPCRTKEWLAVQPVGPALTSFLVGTISHFLTKNILSVHPGTHYVCEKNNKLCLVNVSSFAINSIFFLLSVLSQLQDPVWTFVILVPSFWGECCFFHFEENAGFCFGKAGSRCMMQWTCGCGREMLSEWCKCRHLSKFRD